MRKLLVVILAIVLLIGVYFVFVDAIDISNMSSEEISARIDSLTVELEERKMTEEDEAYAQRRRDKYNAYPWKELVGTWKSDDSMHELTLGLGTYDYSYIVLFKGDFSKRHLDGNYLVDDAMSSDIPDFVYDEFNVKETDDVNIFYMLDHDTSFSMWGVYDFETNRISLSGVPTYLYKN